MGLMGRGMHSTGDLSAPTTRGGTPAAAIGPTLSTLKPPEIDERWAEAILPASQLQQQAMGHLADSRRYASYYGREDKLAVGSRRKAEKLQKQAQELYQQINRPFQVEFERRGGWKRYIIVCNSNGH